LVPELAVERGAEFGDCANRVFLEVIWVKMDKGNAPWPEPNERKLGKARKGTGSPFLTREFLGIFKRHRQLKASLKNAKNLPNINHWHIVELKSEPKQDDSKACVLPLPKCLQVNRDVSHSSSPRLP
jgi:hypothetical protein